MELVTVMTDFSFSQFIIDVTDEQLTTSGASETLEEVSCCSDVTPSNLSGSYSYMDLGEVTSYMPPFPGYTIFQGIDHQVL